jgi:hypothetical protein
VKEVDIRTALLRLSLPFTYFSSYSSDVSNIPRKLFCHVTFLSITGVWARRRDSSAVDVDRPLNVKRAR